MIPHAICPVYILVDGVARGCGQDTRIAWIEAIEIQLHSSNFNRDGRFILSWDWQPVLKQLRADCTRHPMRAQQSSNSTFRHRLVRLHPRVRQSISIYKRGKCAESYHCPDDGVSLRNIELYKSTDAAFCPRKHCW